jgi:serine/threonine protein kinase
VKCFSSWLEKEIFQRKLYLFLQMELCDENLDYFMKNFHNDSNFKIFDSLTLYGFLLATYIFIEILKGVNYLHKQNPQIIHKKLKPKNILLKREVNCFFIKISDIDFMNFQEFSSKEIIHSKHPDYKYIATELREFLQEFSDSEEYEKCDTKVDIYNLGIIMKEIFAVD